MFAIKSIKNVFCPDFHKIGGFEFLSSLFRSSHTGLRWRAAFLLGTVVQNNPYCQERALEMGLLPMLLQLVDKDPDMKVRVKALFAASSEYIDFQNFRKT